MKNKLFASLTMGLLSTLIPGLATLHAQGTAFTYQGRLNDGTGPANGTYNLRFALFDALTVGNQVGSPLTNAPVNVSNGLFTVTLDFGANFPGADRWLEIGVRPNGGGAFTNLLPRQPITATPYAITAGNLSVALPSANLSGTYWNPVTLNNAANSFSGNGSNLTALNASQLASGTVPAAALSNAWKLGGNAGTVGAFLGTVDSQPVVLASGNSRVLSLETKVLVSFQGVVSTGVNVLGGANVNTIANEVIGATIGGGGSSDMDGFLYTPHPNTVWDAFGTVGGGLNNTAGSADGNTVNGIAATVAGGEGNQASGSHSFIGGGGQNTIQTTASYATLGGGQQNTIQSTAYYATLGGGIGNTIQTNANFATVGGGSGNTIQTTAIGATLGGGSGNTIQTTAFAATLGGGEQNTIQPYAYYATIPGGQQNSAASYAFAAGRRAKANHDGAFVWADSTAADFASTAANQFAIRASGGVALSGSTPNLSFGNTTRQMLNLWGTEYGIGVQSYTLYSRAAVGAGFAWYQGGTHSNAAGDSGGGQTLMSLDSSGATLPGNLKFGISSLRQMLDLWGGEHGIGVQGWTTYFRTIGGGANGAFAWYKGGVHADNQLDAGGGTTLMNLDSSGLNVAGNVAYTGQLNKLDVAESFEARVRAADLFLGHSSRRGTPGRALVDNTDTLHLNFASDWANTYIGGNNVSVCTLTIRGGCDIAEPFQMSNKEIPKGAVVVIDEDKAGHLKMSDRACDTRVAGIISGANGVNTGVTLTQEGVMEGDQNVALSGRVYVQADAGNGPIKPGDLLTTSDVPGHAMKVTDHAKAQGAILGKAMTGLAQGQGLVLVLVTLQ